MKKNIFTIVVMFIFIDNILAGSPGIYREHIHRMTDKFYTFLIANNYCTTKKDCIIKEYFLVKPLLDGVRLNFYTITLDKDINKLIKIAQKEYINDDKKIFIELNFYQTNHRNTVEDTIISVKSIKRKKFIHRDSFLFIFYNLIGE